MGFKLKRFIEGAHFEGMLTTLCGYCLIGLGFVFLHATMALLRFKKSARILGLCYVVVKVALLLVIEIIAFPVICGWWLDICSLALFDASLKVRFFCFSLLLVNTFSCLVIQDRQASYHNSPLASIFIHWLIGMVYIFYFASFVILLREILRPGVLW